VYLQAHVKQPETEMMMNGFIKFASTTCKKIVDLGVNLTVCKNACSKNRERNQERHCKYYCSLNQLFCCRLKLQAK
jgi:hypothetical protein